MSEWDASDLRIDFPDELFEPADASGDAEEIARPSVTYWRDVWRRFRRDPLAMIGLTIILLMVLACILVPIFSDLTYDGMDFKHRAETPSWDHLCGTDFMGRDVFIRIMYGARISLLVGVVAAAINLVIGVIYGAISGFVGGRCDIVMMRVVDILSSLPSLLYVLLIMMALGSNMVSVIIALCATSWLGTARLVRSEILRLKHSEYVMAARVSGGRSAHLIFRHLVPNAMGPIIVSTAFLIPSAIFSESFLSYLGIGIKPPEASWGTLASEGQSHMAQTPWVLIFPVAAICVTMLAFNFIGDGLRDALDPRLKH